MPLQWSNRHHLPSVGVSLEISPERTEDIPLPDRVGCGLHFNPFEYASLVVLEWNRDYHSECGREERLWRGLLHLYWRQSKGGVPQWTGEDLNHYCYKIHPMIAETWNSEFLSFLAYTTYLAYTAVFYLLSSYTRYSMVLKGVLLPIPSTKILVLNTKGKNSKSLILLS